VPISSIIVPADRFGKINFVRRYSHASSSSSGSNKATVHHKRAVPPNKVS
jgi:hypothetical protein